MDQSQLSLQFKAIADAASVLRPELPRLTDEQAALGRQLAELFDQIETFAARINQPEIQASVENVPLTSDTSEEKYHALFNEMDQGYILVDVLFDENDDPFDIVYLEANPMAVKMTGTELAGKTTRELDPNYERHWYEAFGRVATTGISERREFTAAPLNVWYSFFAFKVGRPESRRVAVLYQDITERKRIEAERVSLLEREQAARQAAERAVATQRLFLGMISHELRTPLASIKGFSSTLLAQDVSFEPEQQQVFLTIIDEEADRLVELIDQLLDVVQLEAGALRVESRISRVEAIVENAMPQLRTLSSGHPLSVSLSERLPAILADTQRVEQVLSNLIGNAAKFSPPTASIELTASASDGFVQISVHDDGDGIPKSERESVFNVFHQIHQKGKRQPGTGLGLAICKGLIEAQGGRIWIADPVHGTTICFTLPISRAPNSNSSPD